MVVIVDFVFSIIDGHSLNCVPLLALSLSSYFPSSFHSTLSLPYPLPFLTPGVHVTQPSTILDLGHTVEAISKSCFQTMSENDPGADHVKTLVCAATRGDVLARQVRCVITPL